MSGTNDTIMNNNPTSTQTQSGTGNQPGQQTGNPPAGAQTTPPPTGTAPGQQSGSSGSDSNTITIPLTDLDARVAQGGRSAVRDLLRTLGYQNLDSTDGLTAAQQQLVSDAQFGREQQRAAMSAAEQVQADLQVAQQTAESERTLRVTAETERDRSTLQLREFIVRSEIIGAAGGAIHPADVYDWAKKYAPDLIVNILKADAVLFDDDNAFQRSALDEKQVEKIIEKCKADRPEWWQAPIRRTPGSPGHAGQNLPIGTGEVEKAKQQQQAASDLLRRIR